MQPGTALWNCIEGAVGCLCPARMPWHCHLKFCCLQLQVWEMKKRSIATKAFESNAVAAPMGHCKESISDSDTLCLLAWL